MRPLVALLLLAGAARADGFAEELRYKGRTLAALLFALRDEDRADRLAASRVLVHVGPEAHEAAPALLMALKTDDDTVRERLADALARVGPRAVPLLTAALTFDDDRLREGAARALRRLGAAARPALRALEHALARARSVGQGGGLVEAIWAASGEPRRFEEADALVRRGALLRHSTSFLHRRGRDAGPLMAAFVDQLDGRGPARREAAREALLAIGDEAVLALVPALKNGSPAVRLEAADLFGRFHPPAAYAVPAMLTVFPRATPGTRAALARSLGRIGVGGESCDVLRRGLTDASPDVRAECAAALGALRDEKSASHLGKRLADDDPGPMTAARVALERIGKAAVPTLVEAVRGGDELARGQALRALQTIGPDARDAAPALVALATEGRAHVLDGAIAALESVGAVEALVRLAWDGRTANESAVAALGRMKAAAARETLLEALADANADRRRAVIEALGRLGPLDIAPLIEQGKSRAQRPAVLTALARLDVPTRDALPVLARALRDDAEGKEAAVAFVERQGLAGVPTGEFLPLVDDEDRALARRAVAAMIRDGRADVLVRLLTGKMDRDNPSTRADRELYCWLQPKTAALEPRLGRVAIDDGLYESEWGESLMPGGRPDGEPLDVVLRRCQPESPLSDRLAAARRIGARGPAGAKAIPALGRLRADIDAEAEEAALEFDDLLALGREGELEPPDAGELIDAEARRLWTAAITAGRSRAPGASAMMRDALASARAYQRERVEAALRAVGAEETPAPIEVDRLHLDPKPVLVAIAHRPKRSAGLKPLVATMLSHPDESVRAAARQATAAMDGVPSPVPPVGYAARIATADAEGLAALLAERLRPSLRVQALSRLEAMGKSGRAALTAVRVLLREPFLEADVRDAARQVVKACGERE